VLSFKESEMKIFGQVIRTVVNTALLPVALVKDVVTLGGVVDDHGESYTAEAVERLKQEAREDDDE
jgi:hypothetical protein